MKVRLRFFGLHRQAVGREELDLEIPSGATIAQVLDTLVATYPGLDSLRRQTLVALDQNYADDLAQELKEGDELALFSAVSGG